jgi:predicted ArsR family transcriptional regulator
MPRWDQRFFGTTRGQIIVLLRRARRTVDELAAALGLTDNAVRSHLTSLERDGLVQQHGTRRGERRPSLLYQLTADAEHLFPKAYAPVLSKLVDVLRPRLPEGTLDEVLRDVGGRLAAEYPRSTGSPHDRLQVAADVLSALGGLAEVESLSDGRLALRGFSCPLGEAVNAHPELCQVAEALVENISELQVEAQCDRQDGEPPRCCFVVVS